MFIVRFLLISVLFLSSSLWASVGKVSLLKGEAFIERGSEKITLQNGSLIEDKDAIKTGKEAQIQLLFEDKTVITLGSESEFKIEEYLNDAQNPKAKFKFNQGTFKTITGQIGKTAPDNFKMETKTATIGIRGTIVKGSTGDKGDVIACLRGLITVMSRHTGAVVEVPAGKFTTIQGNTAPTAPQETKPGTTDNTLANNPPLPASPTPTTVASVEQTKNDGLAQGTFTTRGLLSGTYAIEGLATGQLSLNFSVNRATAEMSGSFRNSDGIEQYSLNLSGGDFAIFNNVEQEIGVVVATPYPVLMRGTEDNLGIYASDDLFLRYGFIDYGEGGPLVGYFGTSTMNQPIYTSGFSSQYVSWGIWGITSIDVDSLADEQYWVAGPVLTDPTVLTSLGSSTVYTYNGQVLGKTYDGSTYAAINSDTSNVVLKFKFGGSSLPIQTGSSITFSSSHGTWNITPAVGETNIISGNTFEALGIATVTPTNNNLSLSGTSDITGKVFGSNAQAVGGVFSTSNSDITTSTGVFKAVR